MNNNTPIKKPGYDNVIIAEYRLLNGLVLNKEFFIDSRISEEIFTDEIAKSVYEGISNLYNNNIPITNSSLLQACTSIDFNVTKNVIDTIFDIEKQPLTTIDDILLILSEAKDKSNILTNIENIKQIVSQPGSINKEPLLTSLYDIDKIICNDKSNTSELLSFEQWSNDYIEDLEERKEGRKYSYGDMFLDKYLLKGAYPGAITTIAARTSMGKSAYALSIVDNLIEQHIPSMYCSLEMGKIDTFDRLISRRANIDNNTLYNSDKANIDYIISEVKNQQAKELSNNSFYFCESPNISITKLKLLIREFKQKTKSNYAIIVIDLLTQLKNFMSSSSNLSSPVAIEIAMNELNSLAKEENVHIIGLAQIGKSADSLKIHSIEEIENLRPTLNDIKNSNAIAERSRVVLSLFRKKYYADRYLQDDPATETLPDVLDVQILKNTNGGNAGVMFHYVFDGSLFKLIPITEDESNNIEQLSTDINTSF